MRVAAAVPRVHIADARRNAEGALKIMQEAFNEGVEIVVMPELSLVGYTCGDMVLQKKLLKDSESALTVSTTAPLSLVRACCGVSSQSLTSLTMASSRSSAGGYRVTVCATA